MLLVLCGESLVLVNVCPYVSSFVRQRLVFQTFSSYVSLWVWYLVVSVIRMSNGESSDPIKFCSLVLFYMGSLFWGLIPFFWTRGFAFAFLSGLKTKGKFHMACHVWHFFHCLLLRPSFLRVCKKRWIIHWRVTYIVPNLHRNWAKMIYIFFSALALKCTRLLLQLHNFQKFSRTPLETRALRPLDCQVPATLNLRPPSLNTSGEHCQDTRSSLCSKRRDEYVWPSKNRRSGASDHQKNGK